MGGYAHFFNTNFSLSTSLSSSLLTHNHYNHSQLAPRLVFVQLFHIPPSHVPITTTTAAAVPGKQPRRLHARVVPVHGDVAVGRPLRAEVRVVDQLPTGGGVVPHDAAVQVAFERQTLKPFFSLDRS
jgi:hypothetical protein